MTARPAKVLPADTSDKRDAFSNWKRPFLLLALWLGLSLSAAVAAPFRLIVTDLQAPLVPNSIMDVALALGYFAREGVDVELVRVQQTPMAVTALQAGEGEMANIGVDTALQLVGRKQLDLRAVTSPGKSLYYLIAAQNDVATAADLASRSFGVGRVGSVDYGLSKQVLRHLGVDLDGLDIAALGQPAVRAQALAAGQIDATTLSLGAWMTLPDKAGLHVLVPPDAYFTAAPVVSKVNVVLPEVLQHRRAEVDAVVTALIKVSRDIAADPQIWVAAMEKLRPDLSEPALEQLAQSYRGGWPVNGGLSAKELAFTTDWTFKGDEFSGIAPVPAGDWVDFSVVDSVLAKLGTVAGADPADR